MRLRSILVLWGVFLASTCFGQTQISWQQAQSLRWAPVARPGGLPTLPTPLQIDIPPLDLHVEGGAVRVSGYVDCVITPVGPGGLIYVAWYRNRVSVLAGYNTGERYVPSAETVRVSGDCDLIDFEPSSSDSSGWHRASYPALQSFLFFASWGYTISSAPLKGVRIESAPSSYGVAGSGLLSVQEIYSSSPKVAP